MTNIPNLHHLSPHNDVLSATPSTKEEKLKLVEELKSRGKHCVIVQQYPGAQHLYSKAIETYVSILDKDESKDPSIDVTPYKKEIAVLYSNRSLCHLKLNHMDKSHDDAVAAIEYDATYVKGYWRLGQACVARSTFEGAVVAYEKACVLEPTNKILQKECEKVKKRVKEGGISTSKSTSGPKNSTSPHLKIINETKEITKKNTTEKEKNTIIEDCKSSPIRGYKIVGGKKTSYFHHEQTEEEKLLIGDIAPKRMSSSFIKSTKEENNTSAWNKAGTWEEKDLTSWATDTITEQLKACSYTLPPSSADPGSVIRVTNVCVAKDSSAHASVATVRSKKRYIYEFALTINWEAMLKNNEDCTGSLTFPDVDGTHQIGDGYDICDYTVSHDTPRECRYVLERFVRDGGLRNVLEKCLDGWVLFFKNTY